jgi:RNA polymerase sigma-70 factor, ECF subfamily
VRTKTKTEALPVTDAGLPETVPAGLEALVTRAQAGDEDAFEAVVGLTQRRVAAIAYRMLGSADEAKDATQEVYLRLYRFLSRFRAGEDLHGWLYRITFNVCHDMRKRRRPTVPLPDEPLPAAGLDAESSAVFAQRAGLLGRALATLPEKERRAIVLRDLEGIPTEDVARILGSSATTVRSQICSARKRLHAIFARGAGRDS